MARRHRTVLIVGRSGLTIGLGWLFASMVYLAVLAANAAFYAEAIAGYWSLSLSDVVTIQVPEPAVAAGKTTRLGAVLEVLRTVPQIEELSVFDAERTRALLDPWLGDRLTSEIPLPVQIDLRLRSAASLDIEALRRVLAATAPGTEVDDHSQWARRVATITAMAAYGGWLVVVLVGIVAVISVICSVDAGLAVNRDTIALLHLMGARDSFVAGRFQRYILEIAVPACLIGGGLAVVTTLAVSELAGGPAALSALVADFDVAGAFGVFGDAGGLGRPIALGEVRIPRWVVIAAVPVGFMLVAVLVARLAVLTALRRSA